MKLYYFQGKIYRSHNKEKLISRIYKGIKINNVEHGKALGTIADRLVYLGGEDSLRYDS